MIINLLVIFLILLFGGIYSKGTIHERNSNYNRKRYIKLISVILIFQSGLRNVAVGADTFQYYRRFENIKLTPWTEIIKNFIDYYELGVGKDVGYPFFQKVIQMVFSNYQLFLFVIAILFFAALGRFIYYNTTKLNHIVLSYVIYSVLFYSFFSITGHRQTIATAAALYGFEWIKKRKLFSFLFLILIASTIHKSVLIMLPFYVIGKFERPKLSFLLAFLSFPIIMVLKNQIFLFIQSQGEYKLYEIYKGAGAYTFTAMYLLISIVALLRMKYILKTNTSINYYYNAIAIGLFFLPLTWVNSSAMRIVQYFSIFMIVLIPLVMGSFEQYSLKIQRTIIFVSIVILVILFVKSNYNIEYKFFWQEMQLGENYNN
jgi:transmembrane protein EpsG